MGTLEHKWGSQREPKKWGPGSLNGDPLGYSAFARISNLVLLVNDGLGHDLVPLILHSLCLLLLWFTAKGSFAHFRYFLRSECFHSNLSGASVLIASLIKVRVGARLNFLETKLQQWKECLFQIF